MVYARYAVDYENSATDKYNDSDGNKCNDNADDDCGRNESDKHTSKIVCGLDGRWTSPSTPSYLHLACTFSQPTLGKVLDGLH